MFFERKLRKFSQIQLYNILCIIMNNSNMRSVKICGFCEPTVSVAKFAFNFLLRQFFQFI